jgi:GTP-binding protein HflX
VAFNKADLVEKAAQDGDAPAPALSGSVLVSALTGFGLDTLRAEIAALLASLWVDVDVRVPYTAGELLARTRERGTVELDYGNQDVRVHGRAAPVLATELTSTAARWAESLRADETNGSNGTK